MNPELLKWALNRAGDLNNLKEKFPKLTEWIRKESNPTLNQLESFSKATATPLGYFFLQNPPKEQLSIPYFRTVNDRHTTKPSPNLLETLHTMKQRQNWMRDYLIELGQEPLSFVGSASVSENPIKVAKMMRKELGLDNGWASKYRTWEDALRVLMKIITEIGVLVTVNGVVGNNNHRKLDVNEFRGFVLIDEYAPLIFINGADGKAAQMFTLAHELAHIWYGVSAIFDLQQLQPANDEIEQVCNQTAAEFLVPKDSLKNFWPAVHQDPDRFQKTARNFKVSELVVARRALDLKLISRKDFFEFYQARLEREEGSQRSGRGNYYANQRWKINPRFAEAVISTTREGKMLYRDAYHLTGLNGSSFEKFAKYQELGRYS